MSVEDVMLFTCYGKMGSGKSYMEHLREKDKEIERLNNIINELELKLYQEWLEWKDSDCEIIYVRAFEDKAIYDYIQELKGSDKE